MLRVPSSSYYIRTLSLGVRVVIARGAVVTGARGIVETLSFVRACVRANAYRLQRGFHRVIIIARVVCGARVYLRIITTAVTIRPKRGLNAP